MRNRCLFPINPKGLQISHPVIGSIIQTHDDFEISSFPDDLTDYYVKPLVEHETETDDQNNVLITMQLKRQSPSLRTETLLLKNARHMSIVIPRDLLASDALSFFDIRLVKSYPNPIASHIIDTFEILTYLLGDGIVQSWKGKIPDDPVSKEEKDYIAKLKEYKRISLFNKAVKSRNVARRNKFEDQLLRWKNKNDAAKRKALSKKRKMNDDEAEEEDSQPENNLFEEADSLRPTEPEEEEELELPEFPKQPFLTPEDLKNLLLQDNLKLGGGAEDHMFFVEDSFGCLHSFPRVYMDIEHIFKPDENQNPQYSLLFSNEPTAYIIHFTVLDPRICILKGLKRLIAQNNDLAKERTRRARIKDENTRFSRLRGNEITNLFDRREYSAVESLVSWEQWKTNLSVACAMPESFDLLSLQLSMEDAKKTEHSYLDPFMTLNPRRLFRFGIANFSTFNFNLLVADQDLSTLEKAAWRLNMSTEFDFISAYSRGYQQSPWESVFKYDDELSIDCHIYLNPYAVVRILGEDIHHVITLNSILPNLCHGIYKENYYQNSTKTILFPPLSNADTTAIRTNNMRIANKILRGTVDKKIDLSSTICERISGFYFDCNNNIRPEHRYSSLQFIKEDIFSKAFRGLASHAPNLPDKTLKVVAFHDSIRSGFRKNGGIFPDITSEVVNCDYITSTNKSCNFFEWWNRDYLDGPNLSQLQTHTQFMFIFTTIPLQFCRGATQSMIILYGPPGTGKSFVFRPFEKYLIQGTVTPVDSVSAMAFNTGGNHDGGVAFTDDPGQDDPIFKPGAFGRRGNTIDLSGQLKTILTKGKLTRQIVDMTNGRTLGEITTSHMYLHLKLSNHQLKKNCEAAILDRSFVFYVGPSRRRGGVPQLQQQHRNIPPHQLEENSRIASIVFSRFQIFSAYMGYFISCNAITWNSLTYLWGVSIYWKKFLDVYKEIHGHTLHVTNRFGDDRIRSLIYSCVILRLWLEQTPTVNFDEAQDLGFDFQVFKDIENNKSMMVLQEDFIHALSFVDEILPHRCYIHLVRWFLRWAKQLGYDPVKSSEEQIDYWSQNPRFFWSSATTMNLGADAINAIDVNYLDFQIVGSDIESVITQMTDRVSWYYNRFFFNKGEISTQIKSIIHGDSDEGLTPEKHYTLTYRVQDGKIEPHINATCDVLKFETRGDRCHLYVLRSWLDDWVKDPRSFFRDPLYDPQERFMGSPVYSTLKHMFDFKGATTGVFALPGMNLSKIAETDEGEDDIRPYELMKIKVEPQNLTKLIAVDEEVLRRFPDNAYELPDQDGKTVIYFTPTENCETIDELSFKRAAN